MTRRLQVCSECIPYILFPVLCTLFNRQRALLPDIQNSGKWQAFLNAIHETTMRMTGLQRDVAVNIVLKHLAYAKVRMDSTADPLAKMCLMQMPIAYLLSFISSDERCSLQQRTRASALLAKCQAMLWIGAGASADWGLICIAFRRLFDRLGPDISNSSDELKYFVDIIFVINI